MFYTIDSMNRILDEEKTSDPSVQGDTSVLDLQAVVARLDRLEQMISELKQTENNDSGDLTETNNESEDNNNEG